MKNERFVALLAKITRDHVPSECSAASNDERLGLIIAFQDLSEELQGLAEDINKWHSNM